MGRTNNFRIGAIATALAAVLPASLPNVANADDWKFDAGVIGRETYTDNVALTTNPQSDFITEVNPYFIASKKGARFQADFNYTLQNIFYADQSSRNRTYHQLAGRAKAELYENEIFLDANAAITQQVTSLLGPVGAGTTAATGNLTNVSQVSVSPYWQHRFGPTANLLARYTHSDVTSSSSVSNSSLDGVNIGLSSGSAFQDVSWGLNYMDQQINYTSRPDVSLSSISGTLGYAVTGKLRVNGTLGYDDNNYQSIGGAKPAGRFWSVGMGWAPTPRTSISGSFGRRYFGKTYGLSLDHRARRTNWSVSYAEDVTTFAAQFTIPASVSTATFLDALYQDIIADPIARAQFVQQLIAANGWPPTFIDPLNILSQQVYLSKRFDASIGYATAKTTTVASVFNLSRESLESGTAAGTVIATSPFASSNIVKQKGFNLLWTWRLSPRLSSTAGLNWTRNSFPVLSRVDDLSLISLGLVRTFNDHLTGSVSFRHQQRDTNAAAGDFKENAVIGAVNYKF